MGKAKSAIIIALVVIGLLTAIYLVGKHAGKKGMPKQAKLPTGGSGIPVVGVDSKGNQIAWDPGPLADELYDVLDGLFTSPATKENTFSKVMTLSDDQLVALYNEFNRKHASEGDGSMKKWIKDETVVVINSVRPAILARMDRLSLRD